MGIVCAQTHTGSGAIVKPIYWLAALSTIVASVISIVIFFSGAQTFQQLQVTPRAWTISHEHGRSPKQTVEAFYAALSDANGDAAEQLVVSEKRGKGAYSAGEIARFYGGLSKRLKVTSLSSIADDTFQVEYEYVTSSGRSCSGRASVQTTIRGVESFIEKIEAKDSCAS
jgi:hypothetical protein